MNCRRRLFAAMLAPLIAVAVAHGAPLRLAGSDLVGDPVQQALAAHAGREALALELSLTGSVPGREALLAGRAEAALLADAGADTAVPEGFRGVPVAFLAAVAIVHEANPCESIAAAQLAGIFGAEHPADFRHWGDLGLVEDWETRPIAPMALACDRSLMLDLFEHALGDRPVRPTVALIGDVPTLLARVAADRGSIGLVPWPPGADRGVRALSIAPTGAGAAPVGASAETMASGDYPLCLPVRLVFRAGDEARVAAVVRFFATDAAAEALARDLLVALPPGARAALAREFASR